MKNNKIKYTVTLSTSISKIIDDLAEEDCISKPEVFRRAIALYSYINNETKLNKKLCIIDRVDESKITEVLFKL